MQKLKRGLRKKQIKAVTGASVEQIEPPLKSRENGWSGRRVRKWTSMNRVKRCRQQKMATVGKERHRKLTGVPVTEVN